MGALTGKCISVWIRNKINLYCVNNFSWLLISNDQNDGTPGDGIRIDVRIVDMNPFWKPDLNWDMDAFQYTEEFLDYVADFGK